MDRQLLPYVSKENFSSRAFGNNVFQRLHLPGRINLDLMVLAADLLITAWMILIRSVSISFTSGKT